MASETVEFQICPHRERVSGVCLLAKENPQIIPSGARPDKVLRNSESPLYVCRATQGLPPMNMALALREKQIAEMQRPCDGRLKPRPLILP